MMDRDPLNDVLGEWHAPEPSQEFDERMLKSIRKTSTPLLLRMWRTRISVPFPVLVLAAMFFLAVIFWFRPSTPVAQSAGSITQLDAVGFQPLPHGDAQILPVKDLFK